MTLQQLSSESQLSVAFISQVERGASNPSVSSLNKLSSALDVELGYFISKPKPSSMVHKPKAKSPKLKNSKTACSRIDSDSQDQRMGGFVLTMPPEEHLKAGRQDSEILLYVAKGSVEITIEQEDFVMPAGGSAHIPPHTLFSINNTSRSSVEIVCASTSKDYLIAG